MDKLQRVGKCSQNELAGTGDVYLARTILYQSDFFHNKFENVIGGGGGGGNFINNIDISQGACLWFMDMSK